MGELKRWMMQVDELVIENEQQLDQDEESDGEYMNVNYSDGPMLLPNVSPNSASLIASNFLADNQHMLNAYPTPMLNHDNSQNMHIGMNMQPSLHHVLAMQNENIDTSAMFFDVQNGLLMADDMNDLSFPSLSSSFPSDLEQQQQHQQQQQHWSFR